MPACAGFGLLLAVSAAPTSGPAPVPWEPIAVIFGATIGYAVVLARRPRGLRGGAYFLVAGLGWLAAAVWVRAVVADTARPLMLFVAGGADLAGALLADDALGGVLRRGSPWLETHPWPAAMGVGALLGLLVGGVDLAARHDPVGALLQGLAWATGGAVLHRFTVAVVIGAADPGAARTATGPKQERR